MKDGRELGRGWHQAAGMPHAERVALARAVEDHGAEAARGATVYVTLEPCSTRGRTPACTDGLIEAGVARVVYGAVDPNPAHAGRADAVLRAAGVAVTAGVRAGECARLLRGFASAMTRGRPWVVAKSAQSLDGAVTRPPGEGPWLTGAESLDEVQRLRCSMDAILTSGETLRRDDPALTLRVPHPHGEKPALQRVVVTRSGRLPLDARVFRDAHAERTLVVRVGGGGRPAGLPEAVGYFEAPDLTRVLHHLATERGIHRLLVEAGGRLLGSFFDARLIDEWLGWFAPILVGGGVPGLGGLGYGIPQGSATLDEVEYTRFGPDVRVRGLVRYPDPEPKALRPAVFFDRDGVVNEPGAHYYVTRREDFHFNPGIFGALKAARDTGHALVLVTSQRGVGRGLMTEEALEDIHRMMQERLLEEGCAFEAIFAYTGASADGLGAKPDPHFIHMAAEQLGLDLGASWMVGDADRDIEMGRRAGLRTIRVGRHGAVGVAADHTVETVAEVAGILR